MPALAAAMQYLEVVKMFAGIIGLSFHGAASMGLTDVKKDLFESVV